MKTLLFILFVLLVSCEKADFNMFTDKRDGQTYKTVQIGDKIWMAENLNYKPTAPGQKNYLSTDYGVMYPFSSAVVYCPDGWHLPTDAEWQELKEYYPDEESLQLSEFNAKLSGCVQNHEYIYEGVFSAWWVGDVYNDKYAWVYYFSTWEKAGGMLSKMNLPKSSMLTVRCVKDY